MGKIEKSILVNAPLSTVYNQLTQFTEFPRFMAGVQEIRQLDDTHLHWHTKSDGQDREWDAEITEQVPDKIIAWRNTSGPKNTGRVVVEPIGDNQTKITLSMELDPDYMPQDARSIESELSQRNEQDLIHFKQFIERRGQETGEWRGEVHQAQVAQPTGSEQERQVSQSAAQPAATPSQYDPQQRTSPSGAQRPEPRDMQPGTQQAAAESWLPKLMDVWEEPLVVMRRMNEEMDRLFERFLGRPLGMPGLAQSGSRNWTPPVEVARRPNELIICADLPGIRREDVHVEIKADKLTIEGDRHPQTQQGAEQEYRRTERPYGHFYRMIPLPDGVDPNAAAASMHDGVLEITVPVTPPPGAHGRRLDIRSPSSR